MYRGGTIVECSRNRIGTVTSPNTYENYRFVDRVFVGKRIVGTKFTDEARNTWVDVAHHCNYNVNAEVTFTFKTGLNPAFRERVDVFVELPGRSKVYHLGCLAKADVNREILDLCAKGPAVIKLNLNKEVESFAEMSREYINWSIS